MEELNERIAKLPVERRELLERALQERAERVTSSGTQAARATANSRATGAPLDFSFMFFSDASAQQEQHSYRFLLNVAKFADTNGVAAVWVPERHFHAFGGLFPNPVVVASHLAAATHNVRIRAGSVVVPLHCVIRIAEDWSIVDNLSQGRIGISLASGWHEKDFVLAPERYGERRQITFDSVRTLRALWAGDAVDVPRVGGGSVAVRTFPRPIQKELPLWITAAGSPATFVEAGRLGVKVLTALTGNTLESLAQKVAAYRAAFVEHGHPPERAGVCVMLHTFLGESRAQVRSIVREPLLRYLRSNLELHKSLAQTRGNEQIAASVRGSDAEALLQFTFERYFETSALLGAPEDCLAILTQLSRMGVSEIACLLDFGVPEEQVMASLPRIVQLQSLYAKLCTAAA